MKTPSPFATLLLIVALLGCSSAPAPHEVPTVAAAVDHFLTAFNNLDWAAFRDCFAPDATLFNPDIPDATSLHRLDGREAIEANFQAVFNATRQQSKGPPYMHLVAGDLRVQQFQDVAIATFEFGRPGGSIGRRTVVFALRSGRWLIVHLHASNVPFR